VVTFGDVEVISSKAIETVDERHGSCKWVIYDETWVTCKTLDKAKGISNEGRKFNETELTQQ
jgi:hypothetical protein